MTLDEVIASLQQASKDTGWGDKSVDIRLDYKDDSLQVFESPHGIVLVRKEFVEDTKGPDDYMSPDEVHMWKMMSGMVD